MKLTSTLLLAAATATLALTSCSSEPSDWRPDEKVSLDNVAPGTRNTENFDNSIPSGSIENIHSPLMEQAAAAAHDGHMAMPVLPAKGHLPSNTEQNAQNPVRTNTPGSPE